MTAASRQQGRATGWAALGLTKATSGTVCDLMESRKAWGGGAGGSPGVTEHTEALRAGLVSPAPPALARPGG